MTTPLTYTLTISQTGKHAYCVDVPEIGFLSHEQCNLDTALMLAAHAIEAHHKQRMLVLVFSTSRIEAHATKKTLDACRDVPSDFLSVVDTCENHVFFKLAHPLTKEQSRWLDDNDGKLFTRYYTVDEVDMDLASLVREARESEKP